MRYVQKAKKNAGVACDANILHKLLQVAKNLGGVACTAGTGTNPSGYQCLSAACTDSKCTVSVFNSD